MGIDMEISSMRRAFSEHRWGVYDTVKRASYNVISLQT